MSQFDFDLAEIIYFQIQQQITIEKPVITLFPFEEYKDVDPNQINEILEFLAFQNKIKLQKSFAELNTKPEFRKYYISIIHEPARKSFYAHRINNYTDLAKDGDLSDKVIKIAARAFNVMFEKEIPRDKCCKTSIHESNDEVVLLMQELGMARVDWDYLNEQRHRDVGNRLLSVFLNGAEVCFFLDIKLGRKSFIKREALEHISKAVKDILSYNKWIDFFLSRGVSSTFFTTEHQLSKTDLVCSVLSVYASTGLPEDRDLVLSLLEHFAHPLFHGGDAEKANELKNKIGNLIDYDDLVFDGKKIVNKYPASPPTEMKYLINQLSTTDALRAASRLSCIIYDILKGIARYPINVTSTELNYYYIVAHHKLGLLTDRPELKHLKKSYESAPDSLTALDEYYNDLWRDFIERDIKDMMAKIERELIILGIYPNEPLKELEEIESAVKQALQNCQNMAKQKTEALNKLISKDKSDVSSETEREAIITRMHLPQFDTQKGDIVFNNQRCHIGGPGEYQHFICEQLLQLSDDYQVGDWVTETDLEHKFGPLADGLASPFKNSKWVADAVYKINPKFKKVFDIPKLIDYGNARLRIVLENFKITD